MAGLPFFRDLFEALWNSNHEDIKDNLDYMRGEYNPTHSRPTEEKQAICQGFTEAFRLALLPHQRNFSYYPAVLEMFLRYARFYADQEPWNAEIHNLFIYPDLFTPSYFAAKISSTLTCDYIFAEHVRQMETFMFSGLFTRWSKMPGNGNFLAQYMKHSLEFLLYAALNCCDVLFAAQLRWNAALLIAVPELINDFGLVVKVARHCQKRAFGFIPASRDALKTELSRLSKLSKNAEVTAMLNELTAAIETTTATPPAPAHRSLSVETIYSAALKDIMADENLSNEEKEIIRNLREFVPIPPDLYQRIFDQTRKEKSLAPASDGGEFNPETFMQRLIADYAGNLNDLTVEMLLCTGDALMLSRKQVKQWLEVARQSPKAPQSCGVALTWPGIFPGCQKAIARLDECEALEAELRASPAFAKIEARAAELWEIMKSATRETAPDHIDTMMARNSFTAFLSDPGVVKVPTIIYFVFSPMIHHARLQFKGENLQVYLEVPIEKLQSVKIPFVEGNILSLYNCDLDRAISSQFYCKEGSENFAEGLRQSQGNYRVAVVGYPSLTPIKIFNKTGYIDVSGRFANINALFSQQKYAETIQACEALAKDQPALGQVSYMLARTYKTLAVNDIEPEKNLALAKTHYHEELNKVANSLDALLGLGIICKRCGEFAEAERWFELAFKTSPSCIPLIVTWVTTRMSRLTDEKLPTDEIVSDICRHIGPGYLIDPDNQILNDAVDYIGSIFKKFLPGHIQLTGIDYHNM
ncbi:MAG TPA: hypothetical protein PLM07_08125 [Candidatus Rifleibacterium sp.]|nr:hypothetical protein [Candidatus Rifleibacterium sp.]HPT45851.1 hypothetical protein [Candidatus Rifleibacterium sp.]